MDALGTSFPRQHQKTCLHVQGSESWESNFLPESCVGPSLPVLPGILTTHFILTLLSISVDTLSPGDRVIMVCCCDDDDVMRALRLKEDRHPLLTSPPTRLLSVSFFVFLSLPLSLCLSISLCVYILSHSFVCLCLLISPFLSMDFILNSFCLSSFFWPHPTTCGILVPLLRIKPMAPALKASSPNHWTTRVSLCLFLSPLASLPHPYLTPHLSC